MLHPIERLKSVFSRFRNYYRKNSNNNNKMNKNENTSNKNKIWKTFYER